MVVPTDHQWCYFFTLLGSTNSFDVCDKYEAWRGLASSFSFPHISVFFCGFLLPWDDPLFILLKLKKKWADIILFRQCAKLRDHWWKETGKDINSVLCQRAAADKCFFLYYFISLFVCLSVWFGPWQSGASLSLCPFLSLWSALVRDGSQCFAQHKWLELTRSVCLQCWRL